MAEEIIETMISEIFRTLVGEPMLIGAFSVIFIGLLFIRMRLPFEITMMFLVAWIIVIAGGYLSPVDSLLNRDVLFLITIIIMIIIGQAFLRFAWRR